MGKSKFANVEQGEVFASTRYAALFPFSAWSRVRMRQVSQTDQEKLKALALQVLSTQVNDETNIIRLIMLAGQQGLTCFDIQLPYALKWE